MSTAPRLTPEAAAVRALLAESYEEQAVAAARDLRARADFRRQLCAEDREASPRVSLSPEYTELVASMLETLAAECGRLNTQPNERDRA